MSRVLFVTLCGALLLALGFSAALAGVDTTDWYWDAALGLYISWDDSHQVFFIYDPNADAVWAYEPNMGSYYFYDQAADRLYEVGYAGVDNEGELDLGTNEATVEMMRLDSGEPSEPSEASYAPGEPSYAPGKIRRAITDMNGTADGKPDGDAGGFDY